MIVSRGPGRTECLSAGLSPTQTLGCGTLVGVQVSKSHFKVQAQIVTRIR